MGCFKICLFFTFEPLPLRNSLHVPGLHQPLSYEEDCQCVINRLFTNTVCKRGGSLAKDTELAH